MHESAGWMIYGANGYTGRLIAEEAVRRGQRPVLAGRRREAIESLAARLDCTSRCFDLTDVDQVAQQLDGMTAVLHCAGPFSATARPMMDACIGSGTHYLDITGEIEVIEAAAQRNDRARSAGVTLMPAVGFDVVPTDCLAATLAAELPEATHLQLAFTASGALSPGTAKTAVEGLPRGGLVRADGRLTEVPAAWKMKEIPFREGRRWATTIPWGDVASAYYTTGIPNIEVYLANSRSAINWMRRLRFLMPLAGLPFVQRFLKNRIEHRVTGPSAEQLPRTRASLWGCVSDAAGNRVEATLETPGGYPLTVQTALAALQRVVAGDAPTGFVTPAGAFGKDFILTIPDTDLRIESKTTASTG